MTHVSEKGLIGSDLKGQVRGGFDGQMRRMIGRAQSIENQYIQILHKLHGFLGHEGDVRQICEPSDPKTENRSHRPMRGIQGDNVFFKQPEWALDLLKRQTRDISEPIVYRLEDVVECPPEIIEPSRWIQNKVSGPFEEH